MGQSAHDNKDVRGEDGRLPRARPFGGDTVAAAVEVLAPVGPHHFHINRVTALRAEPIVAVEAGCYEAGAIYGMVRYGADHRFGHEVVRPCHGMDVHATAPQLVAFCQE